jgi:predicted LPLAT superfamily acyltransferase
MKFKACAVIPVYNHNADLEQIVACLSACGLESILVDDGSDTTTKKVLRKLVVQHTGVECLTLQKNSGKGAAVLAGFAHAVRQGCTHVLQVDADGQHDLADVPALLALARAFPDKLISGLPVFDDSVPNIRFYGRYITHACVWLETLSRHLRDSMCGFRIYPLVPILTLTGRVRIGRRMDFDTDIMVRLYWAGVDSLFMPTRVHYPKDGISHFRLLADNLRMIWLHIRLMLGMLPRIPMLLRRKHLKRPNQHWAQLPERGSVIGIRIIGVVYAWFGRRASQILLMPVVTYFFITNPLARRASLQFLSAVQHYSRDVRSNWRDSFRHFWQFAIANVDMLIAWRNPYGAAFNFPKQQTLMAIVDRGHGALFISAHLGNLEMTRALATQVPRLKVNALVYTQHANISNTVLETANPLYSQRLIHVQDLGADTVMLLREKVATGEVVVIVGDRTPVSVSSPVLRADFLGRPAPFAVGPYVLAHALECPVYLFFCIREAKGYTIHLEPFAERIHLPRRGRRVALQKQVQRYAARLEDYATRFPLQWYNFYDFWADCGHEPNHFRGVSGLGADAHEQASQTIA